MKIKILLIQVSILIMSLASCKKGSLDPFLSLRTRDSRIVGSWKFIEYNCVYTNSDSRFGGTETNTTMINLLNDTGQMTQYRNGIKTSYGYYKITSTLNIKKDGSFFYEELDNSNGANDTFYQTGSWTWQGKDSEKSRVKFSSESSSSLIPNPTVGNNFFNGGSFYIKRLSHNSLILESKFEKNYLGYSFEKVIVTCTLKRVK